MHIVVNKITGTGTKKYFGNYGSNYNNISHFEIVILLIVKGCQLMALIYLTFNLLW